MVDTSPDGSLLIKYYDENQTLMAVRREDEELYPSKTFVGKDLSFLNEIDSLDLKQGISLEELDAELDEIAKILGIDRSEVISMSKAELDVAVKQNGDVGIELSHDNKENLGDEEKKRQNEVMLSRNPN